MKEKIRHKAIANDTGSGGRSEGRREGDEISELAEIEHTADRAFRVRGGNLRDLFTHASRALFRLQDQPLEISISVSREVEVRGFDRETLLVNWLNEILYLEEAQGETYTDSEILEISGVHLKAKLYGQSGGRRRHLIKAVTFHNLCLQQTSKGWEANVVVDV